MRLLLASALALALSACAITTTASQPYRARGSDNMTTISGKLSNSPSLSAPFTLDLSIAGEPALSGPLGPNGNGTVAGQFKGAPVVADCSGSGMQVKCFVTVSGEHAASLQFSYGL